MTRNVQCYAPRTGNGVGLPLCFDDDVNGAEQ